MVTHTRRNISSAQSPNPHTLTCNKPTLLTTHGRHPDTHLTDGCRLAGWQSSTSRQKGTGACSSIPGVAAAAASADATTHPLCAGFRSTYTRVEPARQSGCCCFSCCLCIASHSQDGASPQPVAAHKPSTNHQEARPIKRLPASQQRQTGGCWHPYCPTPPCSMTRRHCCCCSRCRCHCC